MTFRRILILFILVSFTWLAVGCGGESQPSDPDLDVGFDSDTNSDSDADSESDADADPDSEEPDLPGVDISSGPSELTAEDVATFVFECNLPEGCDYLCQLNEEDYQSCESPAFYEELADGDHSFSVIAVDEDSRESDPATWDWTVDTMGPEVIDLMGPLAFTNETEATFTFDCSKSECDFECALGDESLEACDSPITYDDLDDGQYLFSVRATDNLGNVGEITTYEWTIDLVSPLVVDLDGPADPTNETTAIFDFQCSKDDCTFSCQLNDETPQDCDPGVTYEDLADGEHLLVLIATDELGTSGPAAEWNWTVDTVDPVIEILEGPPAETPDDSATFEFGCSNKPSCEFECSLDYDDGSGGLQQGSWQSCTSPHSVDGLEEGDYTLYIIATDDAGNEGIKSREWSVLTVLAGMWPSVNLGMRHSCGVHENGTLWCWGSGGNGRLGLDDTSDRNRPYQVGSETNWASVWAGTTHTCGLRENGSLWCWGRNSYGELGLGDTSERTVPNQVGSETNWATLSTASVAPFEEHTCGIRENGTLWCWGGNERGQLGLDDYSERDTPYQVGSETTWTAVSAGSRHTCGLRENGSLWCWGYGDQLGIGEDVWGIPTPQQVGDETTWATVTTGSFHTCATKDDGTLWCWGHNHRGQLGLDHTLDRNTPQQVGSETTWVFSSAGSEYTCGLRENNTIWCWGSGMNGRLGLGDYDDRHIPHQVGSNTNWVGISTASHACGSQGDGTLWCWGRGFNGQLGLGEDDITNELTPRQVETEQ